MRLGFLTLLSSLFLTLSVPAFGDQDIRGIQEAIVKVRAVVHSHHRLLNLGGGEHRGGEFR
jgi:hypothetical protein